MLQRERERKFKQSNNRIINQEKEKKKLIKFFKVLFSFFLRLKVKWSKKMIS